MDTVRIITKHEQRACEPYDLIGSLNTRRYSGVLSSNSPMFQFFHLGSIVSMRITPALHLRPMKGAQNTNFAHLLDCFLIYLKIKPRGDSSRFCLRNHDQFILLAQYQPVPPAPQRDSGSCRSFRHNSCR